MVDLKREYTGAPRLWAVLPCEIFSGWVSPFPQGFKISVSGVCYKKLVSAHFVMPLKIPRALLVKSPEKAPFPQLVS